MVYPVYSKFFFRKFGSVKQLLLRNAKIRRGRSCFMFDFKPSSITNDPMFSQQWGFEKQFIFRHRHQCYGSMGHHTRRRSQRCSCRPRHRSQSQWPERNFHTLSYDAQSGKSPSVFVSGNTHGTHVAGTVAAVWNNNLQVVGVCSRSKN